MLLLIPAAACSRDEDRAQEAVQNYLKNQGVQEMKLDLFCEDPGLPNQAYISVTVTYNFGDSSGKPQREFLGYVLKQNGDNWAVQRNTSYTKDKAKALSLLAGNK
jgi:hypothetical protein